MVTNGSGFPQSLYFTHVQHLWQSLVFSRDEDISRCIEVGVAHPRF